MLYNINNYFNIQNSGSGISILTGSSLPFYLFTINGNIKANNINFNFISGKTGIFYSVSGLKKFETEQASGNILNVYGYSEIDLPPILVFVNNFNGNDFNGNFFSGTNFTGNNFSFGEGLISQNIYVDKKMESIKFTSLKELQLSGNLNIYNPTGKIEINKDKEINIDIISNAPDNNGRGVGITGYKNNFTFQNPGGYLDFNIYGNDSIGTIFLKVTGSDSKLLESAPICKISFTGNYSYDYYPSVIINLINKEGIFTYFDSTERNFYVTNINNSGFEIAVNSYGSFNFEKPWEANFNYLIIS